MSEPVRSQRLQRQIDRLLDQAEEAIGQRNWGAVREFADAVISVEVDNLDARAYLQMANAQGGAAPPGAVESASPLPAEPVHARADPLPTSFASGRFQIVRFLGEGGKKRVYEAHDTKLDRDVAFALIKTDGFDVEGLARIRREAQAMGRLGDHPHIVSVFDIGEEGGQPYLVSQLMAGGDVAGLIEAAKDHRLPLDRALSIADHVCQALEYAREKGVIHRDLKPGNVWLTAGFGADTSVPRPPQRES